MGVFFVAVVHFVLIAGRLGNVLIVCAHALQHIMRNFHMLVGNHHHMNAVTFFNAMNFIAFLIEQEGGDVHRQLDHHPLGTVFHAFFFNQTQNGQGQGFDATNKAVTRTLGADDLGGFAQGGPQTLTRELQQAKTRNSADLHARAIRTHGIFEALFDVFLVLVGIHVDKVNHHQATEVTQAHLASNFFCGFDVGVEGRLFDVAAFRRST